MTSENGKRNRAGHSKRTVAEEEAEAKRFVENLRILIERIEENPRTRVLSSNTAQRPVLAPVPAELRQKVKTFDYLTGETWWRIDAHLVFPPADEERIEGLEYA